MQVRVTFANGDTKRYEISDDIENTTGLSDHLAANQVLLAEDGNHMIWILVNQIARIAEGWLGTATAPSYRELGCGEPRKGLPFHSRRLLSRDCNQLDGCSVSEMRALRGPEICVPKIRANSPDGLLNRMNSVIDFDKAAEPTTAQLKEISSVSAEAIDWEEIARMIGEDPYEGVSGGYVEDMEFENDSYSDGWDYVDREELSEDWNTSRKRP
jgi:hypothetical protein